MTLNVTAGPPDPTPEQARAIAARDRDVFLEAGAGTGKTAVLVGRYCDAVSEDGVGTEAILAFTFTERAAGELRSRIRAELMRRSAVARDEGDDERAAELALRARDSERSWISTIHAFCRRLLGSMPLAAGLDPRFRVLDAAEAGHLAERAFDEALEQLTLEREVAALIAAGLQVGRLRRLVLSAYDGLRGQAIAEPRLPPMLEPGGDAYEAVRELFASFCGRYATLKAERSGLDFEDLQLRALALLRLSEAAQRLWRGRFQHILVDEFQDTNRLQVALIEQLVGPETRLFVVGDELQSIYGFRHADLEAFRAQRRRADEAPDAERELMALSGSFRSHPDVVGAVNTIGECLTGADYRALSVGRPPAPEPATDGLGPRVELLLTESSGWNDEEVELSSASESGPAAIAEARALAERLAELVDGGVARGEIVVLLRAYTHASAYVEALRMAGLDPHVIGGRGYWSHQQVEDLLCLLGCVANPLDDEALLGALSSPACGASADALWLLRRAAGSRRHLWPALAEEIGGQAGGTDPPAAKPAGGAEPEVGTQGSLFEIAVDEPRERARRYLAELDEADRERLACFHDRLKALRESAPLLDLEELCDTACRAFGYDLATLAREDWAGRTANIRKLMRLARDYELREGRNLRGFLDYAVGRAAAADAEGQAATEAEGVDGVRIMTIHAAKGLEFGVVAVADLGRSLLAGGAQPDVRIGRLDERSEEPEFRMGLRLTLPGEEPVTLGELTELAEEEAAAGAAEALRLAHVAATRAERRLVLSGCFAERHLVRQDEPTHSASVLARLLPELGASGESGQRIAVAAPPAREGLDECFEASEIAIRVNSPSPARASVLRDLGRSRLKQTPPPAEVLPPLAELRTGSEGAKPTLRPLSYSALSDYSRCGYRFYTERVLGLAPVDLGAAPGSGDPIADGRERRRRFGNAVHRMLEWSARNRWAEPDVDGAPRHSSPRDSRATARTPSRRHRWSRAGSKATCAAGSSDRWCVHIPKRRSCSISKAR